MNTLHRLTAGGELEAATAARRMPRVLVLTSTFPRHTEDTGPRFVLDLCRRLREHAEILVIAPHAPGAATAETLEGVPVRRFRYFFARWQAVAYDGGIAARLRQNRWRALQLPFFFAALCCASWWTILRFRPDVIHAHWIVPQGLAACIAAGSRVPIVCTSHGGDLHGLRSPLLRRIKAWVLGRCRAITVVSDSMVPHVRALCPTRSAEVLPMGTDLAARFVPPVDPATRESDHIVFAGRLVEKKGVHCLLEAFARLAGTRPTLRLTVAGDGPLADALRRHAQALGIAGRVNFLGSVQHSELPKLFRSATLAVFPFVVGNDGDQEGFGLVVVEAMGCGCPVIAGDVPAVHQSIEADVTGILTPAGDVTALTSAMRAALADEPLRRRLAAAALESVRARFDWQALALSYRRVLAECCSGDVVQRGEAP